MLMGLQPDHMFEERNLLCWNPDTALKRNMTWAYPPVLLLKASNDNDGVKERMDNTKNFFRRHVRLFTLSWNREKSLMLILDVVVAAQACQITFAQVMDAMHRGHSLLHSKAV